MKHLLLLTLLSITSILTSNAQVKMTFTVGVSPQQTPAPHHIIVNRSTPRDEFTFDLQQVKAAYFIGLGTRYDMKPFFITAEALYNKREYVYDVVHTFPEFGRTDLTQQMTESMNVVNVPVSLGVDLGIVDVSSGFLPQIILSQQSDLSAINGYSQKLDRLRFGWHSGLAVNINDLRIGVNWQMDFNNYADHVYVQNQNLSLSGISSRILGTMTYQF